MSIISCGQGVENWFLAPAQPGCRASGALGRRGLPGYMEVSIISAAPSCIFLIGSFSVVGLLVRGRLGFCCVFTTDSSVMKLQFTNINITGGFPSFPSGSAVKNPPAALETQETGFNPWIRKIPWRSKWQPTPSILAQEIPWTEEPGQPTVYRVTKSQTGLGNWAHTQVLVS